LASSYPYRLCSGMYDVHYIHIYRIDTYMPICIHTHSHTHVYIK
jgi:hypothetical protein